MTESSNNSVHSLTGLAAAGIVASNLLLNSAPFVTTNQYNKHSPIIDYKFASSSYGDHATLFTVISMAINRSSSFESFYADLLGRQERLGQEFEKLLFDNLWDLYAC